jgi:hypothetical protein
MKYKYLFLTVIFLGSFGGLTSLVYLQTKPNNVPNQLGLSVIPSKANYALGEIVNLSFRLTNESEDNVSILGNLQTSDGSLSVYISRDGKNFNKYTHSKWGVKDSKWQPIKLLPSESVDTLASILWNKKPETQGLNPEVAEKATEGRILSHYAFPESGTYYVKASYYIYFIKEINPVLVESEPVEITIEEPVGENLEVWNKIKDNGDFAYFIQECDFRIPSYKTEERAKFQKDIEQILNQYPDSFYAQSLRQSLDKFKAREEERKAYLKKIQKVKTKQPE